MMNIHSWSIRSFNFEVTCYRIFCQRPNSNAHSLITELDKKFSQNFVVAPSGKSIYRFHCHCCNMVKRFRLQYCYEVQTLIWLNDSDFPVRISHVKNQKAFISSTFETLYQSLQLRGTKVLLPLHFISQSYMISTCLNY